MTEAGEPQRRVALIADDESTTRHLTRVTLERAGFSVVEAVDRQAAPRRTW